MVYRVFLSSTSKDLAAHREAVERAIRRLEGFMPIAMENFGARDATASQVDEARVRECDVFVGLVGHCYGSSPNDNPTSYTEQEFDLATTLGRPRLMLVASDEFRLPASLREPEEKHLRQVAFRARVLEGRVVAMFDDPADLAGLVSQALANWRGEREKVDQVVQGRGEGRENRRVPGPIVHSEIRETPTFTDREGELAALHKLLWAGQAAAVTQPVAAFGLGGIGKSALAREYALRNQGDYAGVWWLNAAKPAVGSPGFEGVERALIELGSIFIGGLDQTQERAKAARQALELIADGGFEKPWLLVYDNVDDARVLREWVPRGNAQVLVTTRFSGFSREVRTIDIEEWELPDAVRYLLQESGRSDLTENDAADIAKPLGRLPLALSHAAALLRRRQTITAANYVASLTRRMSEAPPDAEYPRAVFATFQEAIAQAEREARGAGAVISLAGFFAPDDIPEELFRQPPECYPRDFAELLAVADGMDDAIGALADLSLVDFHPDKRTFSVHRLVQAAARDALGDAAPAWLDSALRTVVSAFPIPGFRTWPLCERLVSHVRAVATQVTADSRELAWLLSTTGDYLRERAALAEVLPLYERTRDILKPLAQADPVNTGWQRDLSVSFERIGNVQSARGNLDAALKAYQDSLAIREKLAAQDPSNTEWQRDLSVSFNKIGDAQRARGDLDAALQAYGDSLAIAEQLAAQDPSNSGWQRDLSVSFNKIGDVQRARGNLGAALKAYQDSHAIFEKLAARDPSNTGWQRDLSVSFERIGDVQSARGNLDAALKAYQDSLAIREKLAAQDPSNTQWQRDLSVSFDRIGNVHSARGNLDAALKSYQDSLAIREKLAAQDPSNAEWQRDLSVSFERIGDVQSAQGNLDAALKACQDSLAIAEKLAAQDPSNAEWRRDLSVSFNKIGDVQRARGNLDAALSAYQDSLAIREKLAARDPSNAGWQRDVWASMWRRAQIEGGGVSWTAVLARMEAMKARGVLLPTDEPYLEQARTLAAGN